MEYEIHLFQTPTSEKKGFYHIVSREDDKCISTLCGSMGYWFGGYGGRHPEQTKENVKRAIFDGSQKLCPSCAMQAYKQGMVKICPK